MSKSGIFPAVCRRKPSEPTHLTCRCYRHISRVSVFLWEVCWRLLQGHCRLASPRCRMIPPPASKRITQLCPQRTQSLRLQGTKKGKRRIRLQFKRLCKTLQCKEVGTLLGWYLVLAASTVSCVSHRACEAPWAGPGGHQDCCVEGHTASPERTGPVPPNSCFPRSSWLPRRFFGCCLLNAQENHTYLNPRDGPQVPIRGQAWNSFLGSGDTRLPARSVT